MLSISHSPKEWYLAEDKLRLLYVPQSPLLVMPSCRLGQDVIMLMGLSINPDDCSPDTKQIVWKPTTVPRITDECCDDGNKVSFDDTGFPMGPSCTIGAFQ